MFEHYWNLWGLITTAELIISMGVGLLGLSFALCLKRKSYLRGVWYSSLRHILTFLAVAGISNAWTILLLGHHLDVRATELMLNISMLVLLGWAWGFYRFNLFKVHGPCSLEKTLKFLHNEVSTNRSLSTRTKQL